MCLILSLQCSECACTDMQSHIFIYFIFSLTSICRNSHGLKDVCSSRLLLPKGENGSLIQKQFIRGGRGTKKTPYPEYESDGSRLFKHFQLTVTVRFEICIDWIFQNFEKFSMSFLINTLYTLHCILFVSNFLFFFSQFVLWNKFY